MTISHTRRASKRQVWEGAEVAKDTGPGVLVSAGMAYLGRQPILDRRRQLVGWELLQHGRADGPAEIHDGDAATLEVTARALLDFGLDHLVGQALGFVNVTAHFLLSKSYRMLPPERVVLELLETVEMDDDLTEILLGLHGEGYRLALDDYIAPCAQDLILPHAWMVKVDVNEVSVADLPGLVAHIAAIAPECRLLAEKVETDEQFEQCLELGFELYQGFLFARPVVVSGRRMPASSLGLLQLAASLQGPDCDLEEVGRAITPEPVLSFRLLQLANSSTFTMVRQVGSVAEAVVYLGLERVRQICLVLALSAVDGNSSHLVEQSTVRGRMCEILIGATAPSLRPSAFTAGVLSLVDQLYGVSMDILVASLPLTDEVKGALADNSGPLAPVLQAVISYEQDRLSDLEGGTISLERCLQAYAQAVEWAAALRPAMVNN